MRTIFTLFGCLALSMISARGDYIIQQQVESMGRVQKIVMKIKEAKARVDTGQTSTIIDSNTGETTMLIHSQKVFFKIPAEQLKAQAEAVKGLTGSQESQASTDIELKPTGKKQTINGYQTEEYVSSLNGTDMSFFVARDFPDYRKIIEAVDTIQKGPGMEIFRTMAISPSKYPGMPIRTEAKFLGQNIVITLDSVQQTDLTDADFSLPTDYKELNPRQPEKSTQTQ